MEGNLYEADQYFKDHPGYDGIAIHHYDYYLKFPKWGTGGKDLVPPELIDSKFVQANDSGYFQFHIVDICGSGLNEDSTMANSKVVNTSDGNSEVSGTWKKDSANYISFYPNGILKNNDKYSFTIPAIDSAGNTVNLNDDLQITVTDVNSKHGSNNLKFNLMQNYPIRSIL